MGHQHFCCNSHPDSGSSREDDCDQSHRGICPLWIPCIHTCRKSWIHGGVFEQLPAYLRVISTVTLGTLLIAVYFLLQYLLPIRSMLFRLGLSVLIAGVLGNVYDKIFYGYVVDFISFDVWNYKSAIFNIADIFQWVGCLMLSAAFLRYENILWPENNKRGKIWINHRFQIRFLLIQFASLFLPRSFSGHLRIHFCV